MKNRDNVDSVHSQVFSMLSEPEDIGETPLFVEGPVLSGQNSVKTSGRNIKGRKTRKQEVDQFKTSLYLDAELARNVKVYCAMHGTSFTRVVEISLEQFLKKVNKTYNQIKDR